jgi:hypothetical protein
MPSDFALSTHLVHQPGIARLKRWGLVDKIRESRCPAINRYQLDFGAVRLDGHFARLRWHYGIVRASPVCT